MEKEVVPAMRSAEAQVKGSCGCALAVNVDDTMQSIEELRNARNVANSVAEGAPKYCTDAASKKAVCQMKTLTISKGKGLFTFKDGHGVAMANQQEYTPFAMMTRVLDK